MPLRRLAPLIALLLAGALCAIALALKVGDISAGWGQLWVALLHGGDPALAAVILELRLPRAVAAFACGGLLATAGALMQVLLRNPLADPYILGISGGAAVAALGAITLGAASFWVDASAFVGAITAMVVVFGLAHGDGSWTQTRLLLTGVIVAAGCGAAVSLMLALAPDTRVMSMLFWMMGDASVAARPWPRRCCLQLPAGELPSCGASAEQHHRSAGLAAAAAAGPGRAVLPRADRRLPLEEETVGRRSTVLRQSPGSLPAPAAVSGACT